MKRAAKAASGAAAPTSSKAKSTVVDHAVIPAEEKEKPKKRLHKAAEPPIREPEPVVQLIEPNIKEVDDDDEILFDEDEVMFDPDNLDRDEDDEDLDGDDDEGPAKPRKSKPKVEKKAPKARRRSATEEFLVEDMDEIGDAEDPEVLDDLDPFSSTIILDPDLPGPPPAPSAAVPLPPRPKRLAPRMQVCVDCRQPYGWLSIEKVCFNCLKKRVAQRKKDEDYSGYGGSDDSGGDDDY
ncbi:MAG: hypothetical protein IPG71_10000 [bacterium]|nr:hypothetical protein [bacterium]